MESTSISNGYRAEQPSKSENLIRSSSLTTDQYLRSSQSDDRSDGRSLRRPFAYETYSHPAEMPTSTIVGNSSSVSTDPHTSIEEMFRDRNMAIRYRFFNRLDPRGSRLAMPDHVVPSDFYSVLPLDDFKDESGKQGSIVTIFSVWNTMMGSSLLAMPWAVQQAGLALGIFLILAVALGVDSLAADLPDVCRYFWGSVGDVLSVFFSVVVLLGGIVVYWVLMSNFLYYTGNVIHEAMQPNSTTIPILENRTFTCDVYCPSVPKYHEELDDVVNYFGNLSSGLINRDFFTFDNLWKLQGSVPIYLAIVTLPLLSFKSATFFTKFNMFGTISVVYLMSFVASKAHDCGINVSFTDANSEHFAELFRWRFPALTGTLTLSYFLHNVVLTILRNQKHPENNARDLSIGYSLAAFTYVFTGSVFFLLFPTIRTCISDNFLNNFGSGDAMSATARLFLLFQMMTVLPLLAYLLRAQFFYATLGTIYPGMGYVLLLNIAVLSLAVSIAIFYPHVGSIIRFVGSFSGLVYIFALPCTIHLKRLHMRGTLTRFHIAIHCIIIFLGAANFFTQFFL
uniref:Amino acid transporter transmembrane domain-containing protein n=1 Tax=Parascaris univalens TaxID=6257 RepID=A0A915AED7_PARUN